MTKRSLKPHYRYSIFDVSPNYSDRPTLPVVHPKARNGIFYHHITLRSPVCKTYGFGLQIQLTFVLSTFSFTLNIVIVI